MRNIRAAGVCRKGSITSSICTRAASASRIHRGRGWSMSRRRCLSTCGEASPPSALPRAMQPTRGRARYDVNRPADGKSTRMSDNKLWFAPFAQWASRFTGRPVTFMLAVASIAVWARTGPLFGYSDTWQLVINTATTIITFLMVFVIQNTQNRDTAAMHIEIDELIRVTQKARNVLLDLEEVDDATLEKLQQDYGQLARKAKSRTSTPARAEAVPKKPGKSG